MILVKIPKPIIEEINRIRKGIKKEKEPPVLRLKEDLLPLAHKNFVFLNDIAKSEPMDTFLKDKKILILDEFSPHSGKDELISRGGLWLETIGGKTGLYYWKDSDFPANRSDSDHSLIKQEELPDWHKDSLESFALLTEEEIWLAIEKFLGFM